MLLAFFSSGLSNISFTVPANGLEDQNCSVTAPVEPFPY